MLEHLGPELARDTPHFVERTANGVLGFIDIVARCRRSGRDRVELQEDSCQELSDLVVQVARNPDALRFLGGEDAAAALPAL
jgi:hypothetical protein